MGKTICILQRLADGPKTAAMVACGLYDHLSGHSCGGAGNHKGGPDRAAVVASWQLGKLARKGLVRASIRAGHGMWELTEAGRKAVKT